jgi:hypothetical protein
LIETFKWNIGIVERWNNGFYLLKEPIPQYSNIPLYERSQKGKAKKLIPMVKGGGNDPHYFYRWKIG